ncbi:hypothetical protein AB0F91_37445 [Amycolatopsis sp. NPDC023774]|uniref:hypothetical protein n=1 Tax=Amycolatopsis sp. NPDC023774 TaxID=3155015 RepID=UPI0033E099AC
MSGALDLARTLLTGTRELGETRFETREGHAMAACWGVHLDFAPDVSGGMFPLPELVADMDNGMSVVEGGAQRLPDAPAAPVLEYGGEVHTGLEVDGIPCGNVRAPPERGRHPAAGAPRGLGDVGPRALYGKLLADVPEDPRRKAEYFRCGPATLMPHLALGGPLAWAAGEDVAEFGQVHAGP